MPLKLSKDSQTLAILSTLQRPPATHFQPRGLSAERGNGTKEIKKWLYGYMAEWLNG